MAQPGSIQVQVPSWISRGSRFRSSFDWLVATYGTRTGDRLTTVQMRNICDSQAVPQACRATLKHQVSGLSWYLSKDEKGDEPLEETDAKGKHYYGLLCNWMDDEGNIVGLASGVDLLTDDILTAREGGCGEVIRDKAGVAQYILHADAATIRFTHDRERPVYQVSPWGEVTEAWEADRFMQVRWHPSPKIGAALLNRTPIQLAYSAIAILAGADTYNWKLITEPIPAGILNLGPGFNRERATQWKASWDASMQGINPEALAIIFGTPNLQYMAFRPPPKDMAFEATDHWYASLVAACFEMSILDISILTRVATKAAAEEQAEATKRQGLRQLMRKVKLGIENYILEDGIFFHFEDIDPTDEKAEADIASKNTERIKGLVQENMLTAEQGIQILKQWKCLPDDVKYDAAEFEKRKEEAQEQFKAKGEEDEEKEEQEEEGGEEEKEKEKTEKSFPGHKGRPGKVGGSLPRGAGGTTPFGSSPMTSAELLESDTVGINASAILEFKDGTKGVFKPAEEMQYGSVESEILTYELSKSLEWDIVPETVEFERGGIKGSLQRWIPDSHTLSERGIKDPGRKDITTQMLLMDCLTDNRDRHGGNVLVDKSGKVWAIDNGGAFGTRHIKEKPRMGYQAMRDNYFGWNLQARSPTAEEKAQIKQLAKWRGSKSHTGFKGKLGPQAAKQFDENLTWLVNWGTA